LNYLPIVVVLCIFFQNHLSIKQKIEKGSLPKHKGDLQGAM